MHILKCGAPVCQSDRYKHFAFWPLLQNHLMVLTALGTNCALIHFLSFCPLPPPSPSSPSSHLLFSLLPPLTPPIPHLLPPSYPLCPLTYQFFLPIPLHLIKKNTDEVWMTWMCVSYILLMSPVIKLYLNFGEIFCLGFWLLDE